MCTVCVLCVCATSALCVCVLLLHCLCATSALSVCVLLLHYVSVCDLFVCFLYTMCLCGTSALCVVCVLVFGHQYSAFCFVFSCTNIVVLLNIIQFVDLGVYFWFVSVQSLPLCYVMFYLRFHVLLLVSNGEILVWLSWS